MNKRTRRLVVAMLVVGLAVLGDAGYRRFVEEPAKRRERELSRLESEIEAAENSLLETSAAADQLRAYEQWSLPYDEEFARARYQDWLLTRVERARFQQPSVNATAAAPVTIRDRVTRKPKEVYKQFTFTVRGSATLQQATQFFHEFYSAGMLHKIRTLSLTPAAGGKRLAINMTIEALSLSRCERERKLPQVRAHRLAFDHLDGYRSIVHRNLFSRDAAAALRQVTLTAVTLNRAGVPEAWFSVGTDRPTKVVHRGESFTFPPHHIHVIDIQGKIVVVQLDGSNVRLPIGKSLVEAAAERHPPRPSRRLVDRGRDG